MCLLYSSNCGQSSSLFTLAVTEEVGGAVTCVHMWLTDRSRYLFIGWKGCSEIRSTNWITEHPHLTKQTSKVPLLPGLPGKQFKLEKMTRIFSATFDLFLLCQSNWLDNGPCNYVVVLETLTWKPFYCHGDIAFLYYVVIWLLHYLMLAAWIQGVPFIGRWQVFVNMHPSYHLVANLHDLATGRRVRFLLLYWAGQIKGDKCVRLEGYEVEQD